MGLALFLAMPVRGSQGEEMGTSIARQQRPVMTGHPWRAEAAPARLAVTGARRAPPRARRPLWRLDEPLQGEDLADVGGAQEGEEVAGLGLAAGGGQHRALILRLKLQVRRQRLYSPRLVFLHSHD